MSSDQVSTARPTSSCLLHPFVCVVRIRSLKLLMSVLMILDLGIAVLLVIKFVLLASEEFEDKHFVFILKTFQLYACKVVRVLGLASSLYGHPILYSYSI